ncbi:MAG: DUF2318 domain-containing protein [Clostridia bacterium]|nr:DUF2318 domain-containing protein [Clostridia bacterium]
MGNNKSVQSKQSNKKIYISLGILVALLAGFFAVKGFSGGGETVEASTDLVIPKAEVSETARYYPYKAGKTNMEVIALKASDGSVRTAFNTCQVCYDSGRGYYKQQGDTLVCQNCGNKFKLDQVEKVKGGCNPVPITKENKTEDGANITISKAFLEQGKELFGNWKKQ